MNGENDPVRRIIACFLALAFVLTPLPFSLTSCREKTPTERLLDMWERDRAFALYDLLMENAVAADSFTIHTQMEYQITHEGTEYTSSMTMRELCADQNGESLFLLSEKEVRMQYGSTYETARETQDESYVFGYADGYAFRSQQYAGMTTTQKTPMTADEYRQHAGAPGAGIMNGLYFWNCASVTCRRLPSGGWEARFGGFNQESLDILDSLYGWDFSALSPYIYLSDAEVTLLASEDFRFETIYISMEYAEYTENGSLYANMPTVYYTSRFEGWNETAPETVELEHYENIGDIRVIDNFLYGLDARTKADRDDYITTTEQTVTRDGVAESRAFDVKISFDTVEKAFGMKISTEGIYYDGYPFSENVTYEDGVLTRVSKEGPSPTPQIDRTEASEAEARALLASRLNITGFCSEDVVRVETLDEKEGRYRLHLGYRLENMYAESYADSGNHMTFFESYVDITQRDGVLYAFEYVLRTKGILKGNVSQDNILKFTCDFSAERN